MPVGWWTVALALCAVPGGLALGPGGMLAVTAGLAALAATLVVVGALQRVEIAASPMSIRRIALRERSRRTAFLRWRDPDAPGHARPRAPGL